MFPVTGLASDGEDSAPLRSPCGPAPPATLCPSLVVLVDPSCDVTWLCPSPTRSRQVVQQTRPPDASRDDSCVLSLLLLPSLRPGRVPCRP